MKIRSWHIDGFGVHRDWRVDDVSPGLTVFHGPNEAGKTTLLAFLRGVLFGYPDGRSNEPKYAPVGGGVHGGRVTLSSEGEASSSEREASSSEGETTGEGSVVVERFVGRNKLSITLEDGRPGDAGDLSERLGQADARLFRNVYAFGLAELQELATLGDAGVQDYLFSAGITGAGRSARQAVRGLDETSRDLFAGVRSRKADRARALALEIAEKNSELALRHEAAERYPELRDSERGLATRLDALKREAEREQSAARRARKLVELWNEVWSPLADMREQAAKLSAVDPDELPLDARPRLEASLAEIQADQEKLAAIGTEREALGRQVADLRLDDAARGVSPRVEALHGQLALHRSRCERLAELDLQLGECDRRRESIAVSLDQPTLRAFRGVAMRRDELREWKRQQDAARRALAEHTAAKSTAAQRTPPEGASRWAFAGLLGLASLAALSLAAALWADRLELVGVAALLAAGAIWLQRRAAGEAAALRDVLARECEQFEAGLCECEAEVSDVTEGFASWKRSAGIPSGLGAETAGEFLEDVRRARDLLEERDRLAADRRRIESEVAAWEAGVDDVVADLGAEHLRPGSDRCALLLSVRERCEADRTSREHRKPLEARGRDLRERFVGCEASLAEARKTLAALLEEASASDPDDLQRRLAARDAARELAERIAASQSDLSRRLEAAGPEESAALREELPRGRVDEWEERARESSDASARASEERDEVLRLHQNAALALERLERSTEVAGIEQGKAALAQELREVVDEWRKLRLASRLIEAALERFEGQHQPGVLREAGRLFARVTGGRYQRIVQSQEQAGFSVLTADGMHKSPRDLSRGTAEQLYLCVRLGLVAELTRARASLPVVMDDVLVNFDDERAAAMAAVLADFAREHQLFFFTCNSRTRELLVAASPAVDQRELRA